MKKAFTMAEILLSLTIIGVVAAITLPSLTGNINERTWNTQRKALYARISQAISLMPALNGYGTISAETESASAVDTATETFLTAGLAKVLKINNICDNEHLEDCGVVTLFTNMTGSQITMPTTLYELSNWFSNIAYSGSSYSTSDTKAAAFETQNGESIIAFYNQSCRTEYLNEASLNSSGAAYGFPQATMCVNFIYDLNGNKGPNTFGKDMGFMTVFNATDSVVVAPMPFSGNNTSDNASNWYTAQKVCTAQDTESRIPNINELSAMIINKNLINLTADGVGFWSSSAYSTDRAWDISPHYGLRFANPKTHNGTVRCIKR
ncbi:MAG: prepilin-type N-terminal cleavage/methylation domain-containing protein [Fusobacterium sp.]|nr:prepilin-type N-terminal cleavage/methylation domain-containing protein [Fusobacterium sp.]